jgi:hypothetical protein
MLCHDRSCVKALTLGSNNSGDYNRGLYNEAWFATHWELSNVGVEVRNLNNGDVFVKKINSYFGPQQGKNGWKYNEWPPLEEQDQILLLYKQVIKRPKVYNNQLNLGFAGAIVVESEGLKVKASYGAYSYNYCCQLKVVKEEGAHREATQLALGTLLPIVLPLP